MNLSNIIRVLIYGNCNRGYEMNKIKELCDEELIDLCIQKDVAAFAELIHRHEAPLLSLIRYEVEDKSYQDDIFQETLLKVWLNLDKLKEADKFKPWLYSIARNECKNYLRKKLTKKDTYESENMEFYMNKYGRQIRDGRYNLVREALDNVSDEDRQLINLFYYYGLSVKEISKYMDCPEGTVKRKLHYARNHLRDRIDY